MKYQVVRLINFTYQVIERNAQDPIVFFQGDLADCEAWIRLQEGGYF